MNSDVIDKIIKCAQPKEFPDQTSYNSISVKHVANLSKVLAVSGHQIEIIALEHGVVPERYVGNMRMFSPQDQVALLRARVSVVGLGGLGGAVVEILARMGVGTLTVIDGDTFKESDLNRQFLSAPYLLHKSKAEAAARRIKKINSSLVVAEHPQFLDEKNAVALLDQPNVTVDCLDDVNTRFILQRTCQHIGSPLVSAAVAGSSGHVTSIFPGDQGFKLIYGQYTNPSTKGAETSLGTVPFCVTFLAALECAEVTKIIQKKGSLLRNKLLVADLKDGLVEVMNLV